MAAAVPEDSTVVKKTVLRMVTLDVCLGCHSTMLSPVNLSVLRYNPKTSKKTLLTERKSSCIMRLNYQRGKDFELHDG